MFYEKYKEFSKYYERSDINFFDFIQKYSTQKKIPLQTYSLSSREKACAIHRPEATINLLEKERVVLYKQGWLKPETVVIDSSINQLLEQANYTNLFLQILGSQLSCIEKSIHILDSIPSNFYIKDNFKKPKSATNIFSTVA